MSNLLVSAVIPMYNSEETILKCINSVITQTYSNIEIIIVDDGSTDNSFEIVMSYIKKNRLANFQVLRKQNGGVSSARNEGLKISKGEYISFLDSDDQWVTQKIENQLKIFKKFPEYDFIGGLISNPSNKIKSNLLEIKLSDLIFKNYFQPSTVLMKRKVFEKIGFFDDTQKYAEEGNYFMRIAKNFKCGLINEQLVIYGNDKKGFGHSGLSANLKEMEKGELKNLKFAYTNKYINAPTYITAVIFSIIKYFRRIFVVSYLR